MSYWLKNFDISLLKFEFISHPIEGVSVKIQELNNAHRAAFPLDLIPDAQGLLKWLKQRVIPKNRAFVHQFLAKLNLNVNDIKGIIDISKGLSVNDCYWIVDEQFNGLFADYNLYQNHFNRTLSLLAYTGYGDSVRSGFTSSPEFTTDGMLAKCWRRIKGEIVLYKAGSSGAANTGNEPYAEYYASQIAQQMGLNAVVYDLHCWKGSLCSTCALFSSQNHAYIPTGRLVTQGGWRAVFEYYQQLGESFHSALIDMLIFDALICNEDRHFGNFGLLVDNQSNQIIATAPLFDHGLSLFNFAMPDELKDVQGYAQTRLMRDGQDFIKFAQAVITARQKQQLKKLINFKFKRHSRYNWSKDRLKQIEQFLQLRISVLLAL